MRVLVCGGRDFKNDAVLDSALSCFHAATPITLLIHGAAPGADSLASVWAQKRGIPVQAFPADWTTHGKAAGPIRNRQMLDEGKPDVVIAFIGGKGTDNMISQAAKFGIRIIRPGTAMLIT